MKAVIKRSTKAAQSKENYLKLLSIIAHNVKAPVKYMEFITEYTIRNWAHLKPEDLLDCASVIHESARNISEQLGKLLSWARLQDGTFKPNKRLFILNEAIKQELHLQRPVLKMKEIEVKNSIDDSLKLISDSNILRLALHNIVSNAIKFTAKSGTITIGCSVLDDVLILSIRDTGTGMNPEELALLYDNISFSNPGTVNELGTGFGLRIAKEMIELLDGNLEIDSELGVGTTVTICLPA